jgi:hypothetical protein
MFFSFFQWNEFLINLIWLGLAFNPSYYFMSFDWVLRPFTFIFSVKFERWLLFPVLFVPLLFHFTYSFLTGLLAQKGLFFLEYSCLTLASPSICKSSSSIFCSAGLVVANSFSFSLLWKVLISPSFRKDSFAR